MHFWCFFLASLFVLFSATPTTQACKGCVSLDELNFEKIISRFEVVMVKFDVAYPYGDKHEVFTKLAEEVAKNDDLIMAEVGVKDYGDKDNEELAKEYGLGKDDFPAIRLFVKGKAPIEFPKDADWTVDNLRNLIKDNSNVYVGLPGCLEKFDRLAEEFVHSGNKQKKLEEAEQIVNQVSEEERGTASQYIKFMKKIVEVGTGFVSQELARLNKILKDGKVNEKKKMELAGRVNILRSFSLPKDEL
ncbi:hypothetical protein Zmor_018995 [Zophobas morio]|uniref:Endoplasmic reticulum resident protein 29 n=1 Tax=Zophobas morio TaxID=2755281 RepID=A0AA38ME97_9CUCU|nr:hypothetical protein Zmor_018995 [Zophobas morio]